MDTITTDVLIVGSGIAALNAAIVARRRNCEVLVITKGQAGKSGCSIISEGILNAPFTAEDSPELFYNDIIKGSGYAAVPALAQVFAERARETVLRLEDIGVRFVRDADGLVLDLSGGHSAARSARIDPPGPACGKIIPIKLLEHAQSLGVRFLEDTSVVKLFERDGRVGGGLGFKDGTFNKIQATAVVMATGGAGWLFRNTTNPSGIAGDGCFLAQDVGARLKDMEYVQFFPTVAGRSYLVLPFVFTDGAVLLNGDGERFIDRYDPELMEKTTRDKMSRAIFTEVKEGRGIDGGVHVSYQPVPRELLEGRHGRDLEHFRRNGIDLLQQPVLVRPSCHFIMGGIGIDADCSTGVEGLFAGGECTGGAHGANRLAGNALTEALVFGEVAGESAARHAEAHSRFEFDPAAFVETLPATGGADDLPATLDGLRDLAWNHLCTIRNAEGIAQATATLDNYRDQLAGLEQVADLGQYCSLRNAVHALSAIALAAQTRTESRGAHYRSDYPEPDAAWGKGIVIHPDQTVSFDQSIAAAPVSP